MSRRLTITIDGPSGAGKSTLAKMLARSLRYRYIDTGAMYRGVAYAYRKRKGDVDLDLFLKQLSLRFMFDEGTRVLLDGEDISCEIRDPEVSLLASSLSQDGRVRAYLTGMQREMGKAGGVVLEGRDTGSVVFPDADLKFYLDADVKERVRRRHLELVERKSGEDMSKVKEEMEKRDRDDSERQLAPLVRPENAVYVDTTGIDIEGVLTIMETHVTERLEKESGTGQ